jgi:hypothetical protein
MLNYISIIQYVLGKLPGVGIAAVAIRLLKLTFYSNLRSSSDRCLVVRTKEVVEVVGTL